jgi:alpha-tubulin suppressor-like RCC1 family protein
VKALWRCGPGPTASAIACSGGALDALLIASVLGASLGCNAVFGLNGYEPADAGTTDAGDADDAARVVFVASGNLISDWCAVLSSGDVECWGNNEHGELGDGTSAPSATPVKVKGLPDPAQSVTIGDGTVCALLKTGAAYCWGLGIHGELGNGTKASSMTKPSLVHGLESGVTSLSAGGYVTCAVRRGALFCWGGGTSSGTSIGLGTSQTEDAIVPTAVPSLTKSVTAISVGDNSACAVQDGAVFCWGGFDLGNCTDPKQNCGELGNGRFAGSYTPVRVTGLSDIVDISVGGSMACARNQNGGVTCWGYDLTGELGDGQTVSTATPVHPDGFASGIAAISVGELNVVALKTDGTVWVSGYDYDGELGDGQKYLNAGFASAPVAVSRLSGRAVAISSGRAPCAALQDGSVECWGTLSQLALSPVRVPSINGLSSISAGGYGTNGAFVCASSEPDYPYCWGGNNMGQLGIGSTAQVSLPQVVGSTFTNTTSIAAGTDANFACMVAEGGLGYPGAYCWGDNTHGQLGNGTTKASDVPVPVTGLPPNVTSVSAGSMSACALAEGTLYCWGANDEGQLGNGTFQPSTSAAAVTGLPSASTSVSVGRTSACAVVSSKEVYCWGDNSNGQLGDGTTTSRSQPVLVRGLTDVSAVSSGWFSTCAIANGAVRCWGNFVFGLPDLVSSKTPQSVGISSGATQVAMGAFSACAVVNGGAVCWGIAPLGTGDIDDNPSPVQVSGLSSGVSAIAVGRFYACAVVRGGVQCWGSNSAGQLGNGGATNAFVPTRIEGLF